MASALSRFLKLNVAPLLVRTLIRTLNATWGFRTAGWARSRRAIDSGKPLVGAFFHGRQPMLSGFFARPGEKPWTIMVSRSLDGKMQNNILSGLGYHTVRGSSSRGGAAALVTLIKVMRNPETNRVCMAVDGSKGPVYRMKPGVLALAAKSGCALIPCVGAADRSWVFKRSWDQFTIPKPWASVGLLFGPPVYIPPNLSPEAMERVRLRFEQLMWRMFPKAERLARGQAP
jgi:lysophospholipid acyltransferase (LPLAT)-like uncharacterized protein